MIYMYCLVNTVYIIFVHCLFLLVICIFVFVILLTVFIVLDFDVLALSCESETTVFYAKPKNKCDLKCYCSITFLFL